MSISLGMPARKRPLPALYTFLAPREFLYPINHANIRDYYLPNEPQIVSVSLLISTQRMRG